MLAYFDGKNPKDPFEIPLRVLILEDDEYRVQWLRRKLNSYNFHLVWVSETDELVKQLSYHVYDWIFLDHDLGGEVFVDPTRRDTGAEAARWMENNFEQVGDAQIVIHSLNPAGAFVMQQALPCALRLPFPPDLGRLRRYATNRER